MHVGMSTQNTRGLPRQVGPWECRMGPDLLNVARGGGFWSYIAGVAYVVSGMHTPITGASAPGYLWFVWRCAVG